jgi:RNA polymerase sigma factor, sigma-70 family
MQEDELILAVKSGSERAYKQLYELWVSRLYRFVFQYLKSEEATDDVVQETFLRIWTNREHLNPDQSFKSYLFTIAYHFLLKELRRQIYNPSMEEYVEYRDKLTSSANEIPDGLDYDRFVKALEKAKQHLSPRQREIFELNKEYGVSVAEISGKLSVTEQVVRNQLSAALKILRTELRQYYPLLLLFLA